jgi:hypothetical protein
MNSLSVHALNCSDLFSLCVRALCTLMNNIAQERPSTCPSTCCMCVNKRHVHPPHTISSRCSRCHRCCADTSICTTGRRATPSVIRSHRATIAVCPPSLLFLSISLYLVLFSFPNHPLARPHTPHLFHLPLPMCAPSGRIHCRSHRWHS